MYVFGDLTNLFVNYNITREVFDSFTDGVVMQYSGFTFNDSGTIVSFEEAVATMSANPGLIETQDNLTSIGLIFANLSNISVSFEEVSSVSCVVFNYAREEKITVYEALKNLVRDRDLSIKPTDEGCNCVRSLFEEFGSQARCLTDETFFFGDGGVDGILWQIYLFIIIIVAVFIAAYIQISFIQTACERQIQKMRLLYYSAVLRQDIGWFDLNPGGEVSSRLNE